MLTYLSKFPEALREAFSTGGMAPIARNADEVYQATYLKVIERNEAYYEKYPEDIDAIHGDPSPRDQLLSGRQRCA